MPKNDQNWNWLILIHDWKVMTMSDVWPKSKAITLVLCRKMTKIEIDWFWIMIENVMKMSDFWPKSKAITLVFCRKWPKLKLINFDSWLKSDENERFLAKSKAITLVFCRKMTKIEIDWFWFMIEKWWKWAIFGQKVRL